MGESACSQLACHPWPVDGVPTDGGPILGFGGWGQGRDAARQASLVLLSSSSERERHRDGGKNKSIVLSPRVAHGTLGGCCGHCWDLRRLWEKLSSGGPGPPHCPLVPYQAPSHPPPRLPGLEQTFRCPEWTQDEREQIAFVTHAAAMTPTR